MGPSKSGGGGRTISQQAFDEMVRENIEDLEMDPTDALQDAIETLTLQHVDLSGIVTCVPGDSNPVVEALGRLKRLSSDSAIGENDELVGVFDELSKLCGVEGSGNAAIAARNGGLELVCAVCENVFRRGGGGGGGGGGNDRAVVSGLNTMAAFLHDLKSTETFRSSNGPKLVMLILNDGAQDVNVLNRGFSVVAAAATGNEVLKESFMDLKIDELIISILSEHSKGTIPSTLYDAIRVLLTADDNRVVASQVFGYARRFAKIGIAEALVNSLREGFSSPSLVSASIALKAVAVNDEICKSVAEIGGIDAILRCIDDSGEMGNKAVAKVLCSLLTKLAGSDTIKSVIVEKGGMDRVIKLSTRFSDDPSVLQEVMSIICTLSLRSPDNAARAIEAGAGDLVIQSMQKFSEVSQLQKSSCLMIRNLVVRNAENRTLLLNHGIEKIIRTAKKNHPSCKEAATDALRDLGLNNYNL